MYISVYSVKSQLSTKCGHIRVCAFVRSNTVKYFTLQEPESNCPEKKGMCKQNSPRSDCSRRTISADHLLIHFMDFSISLSGTLQTYNHTGKCVRRFAGIYTYCWYFIDRKW